VSLSEGDSGTSADSQDALQATARLVDLEHDGDKAERDVTSLVLSVDGIGSRGLTVLELARTLEHATDRLASMGHLLHTYVMGELSS
jgi:uncharacterized protein Yka (UPF0111/DUF47 family)